MVQFLCDLGAGIDVCDNEGWTALHATASCGFLDVARFALLFYTFIVHLFSFIFVLFRYLISVGASVSAVNNDGELAFDLAEGEDMEKLLENEMEKQGMLCY